VRIKVLVIITIILVLIFAFTFHNRREDNVLMEIVYYSGDGSRGSSIYHFVVKDDGTLISTYGSSRSDSERNRTRNFIRIIRAYEITILSDDDFMLISKLTENIVSGEAVPWWLTDTIVTFVHNGNIYEHGTTWSNDLFELVEILLEIAPPLK